MQEIPLDCLLAYARCPLSYWWQVKARIVAPETAEALPARSVREALRRYYSGRAPDVGNGVSTVWGGWLASWGCPSECVEVLAEYGRREQTILAPFIAGKITRDDGSRYQEPRMTRLYKEMARGAGLESLRRQLEHMIRNIDIPVVVTGNYDLLAGFSDAMLMAMRYAGPERGESVQVCCDLPFMVSLSEGVRVTGTADLAVLHNGRVFQAEVHDYGHFSVPPLGVPRLIQIICLGHAEGEAWHGGRRIVYRHMASGTVVEIERVEGVTRLLPVVSAALRGVQCGVFLPRLAVSERECLHCRFYGLCVTAEGLDVLDDLDATLLYLDQKPMMGNRR